MIVLIRRSHLIVRESLFCFDVQHDLVLSFPLFLFPPSSPETKEFPSYSEGGGGGGGDPKCEKLVWAEAALAPPAPFCG